VTTKPKVADNDWQKQLRMDMAFAEKTLLAKGAIMPMFVVHSAAGVHAIGTPWHDDEEKAQYRNIVRLHCIALNARAVSVIVEAWTTSHQRLPGEGAAAFHARVHAVLARDSEARREVVVVHLMYRDGDGVRQIISDTREIERRANGKPSGLVSFGWRESGDVTGPLLDVFPETPPTDIEQAVAREKLASIRTRAP
jgi:hypothetical protein